MTSTNSEENSKAPEKFHICNDKASVTGADEGPKRILKCPLCRTEDDAQHLRFHCRTCVRNGNVVHSSRRPGLGPSLKEKQQKYLCIQSSSKDLSNRYDNFIKQQKTGENIRFEIMQKQEKIQLLLRLIAEKKVKVGTLAEKRNELSKANTNKRKHLPNYPIKVKELKNHVLDGVEKSEMIRKDYCDLLDTLKEQSRLHIAELVKMIFPISRVFVEYEGQQRADVPVNESAEGPSYLRDEWVLHESDLKEIHYRIAAPTLSAIGNYSAYFDWLAVNKEDVPDNEANEVTPSRVQAFCILAGLAYTAQLTQMLSYYLNVCLPYNLNFSDFCKRLNKNQFLHKVSHLNYNVIYLAYTQKVDLTSLKENHTLENILAILDVNKCDLGRFGNLDVKYAPMTLSNDSLLQVIETATDSESEDENSLRLDWESLPNMTAQEENILPPMAEQPSSMAESLITTAVNRLFRWRK